MKLTDDEDQILNATIIGCTATDVATWTAFPISKVRRLLKSLHRRGLVRRYTIKFYSSDREHMHWEREGPLD